jgi:hypothetical protein
MIRQILSASILLVLCGCQSSVRQASHTANLIRETARSSEARFGEIEHEIALEQPDLAAIASQSAVGAQEQRRIQQLVGGIQETLTATQDRQSAWIGVLNLWGWIALAGLALFVTVWFGITPLVRKAIAWVA